MKLHNRKSMRAQWWDYSNIADYHITFCTKDRECFFGAIENGEMLFSEEGKIAKEIWQKIPEKFPNIKIYEYIIMPNHIHGLIGFGANPHGCRDAINRVPTSVGDAPGGATGTKNPMLQTNLSTVIRWFKGRCSYEIRKINPNFKWQSRFHDSIIKSKAQFEKTQRYIRDNPREWIEE